MRFKSYQASIVQDEETNKREKEAKSKTEENTMNMLKQ